MDFLYFATTNKGKLAEAEQILKSKIEGVKLDVPEIQSMDIVAVARHKAKQYFGQLKHSLFVEDTGLIFGALNGLPGAYTHDMSEALGNEGLIKLLTGFSDKTAVAVSVIVYVDDKGKDHVFEGRIEGVISDTVRGEKGFGWDPIFIPKGYKITFAQMDQEEKNKISMRKIALEKMRAHLIN